MSEFPTDYQRWRQKAIKEGYPRCSRCNEPVQKQYQKRGTLCRQCTHQHIVDEAYPPWPNEGTDAVAYERAGKES